MIKFLIRKQKILKFRIFKSKLFYKVHKTQIYKNKEPK